MKKLYFTKIILSVIILLFIILLFTSCNFWHEHAFTDTFVDLAPTCIEKGEIRYICRCGYQERREVPALGHKAVACDDIAPMCTMAGVKDKSICSVCSVVIDHTYLSPLGHRMKNNKCEVCGALPSEGLQYTLSYDGTYYSVSGGTFSGDDLIIPSHHNDLPVKEIPFSYDKKDVRYINIPYTVESITSMGFWDHDNVESVTVDEDNLYFKSIDSVLYNKDVTILLQYPEQKANKHFVALDTVREIDEYACFRNNFWETVDLNNTITVGRSNFWACHSLEKVTFGDSLVSIGTSSFECCDKIVEFCIPENLEEIGDGVFTLCESLEFITVSPKNKYFTVIDNVLFSKDMNIVYCYPSAKEGQEYKIPEGVTTIMYNAFYCNNLVKIILPNSIQSISPCCNNQSFSNSMIYNEYEGGLYFGSETNPYLCFMRPKDVESEFVSIHPECRIIYYQAFVACPNIQEISIPKNIIEIGALAFSHCKNLKRVYFNAANFKINLLPIEIYGNRGLFYQNNNVELVFGANIEKIPEHFSGDAKCYDVKVITFDKNVREIGKEAFSTFTKLECINYNGTISQWNQIIKGELWDGVDWWDGPIDKFVIHCTDGDIFNK